MNTYKLDLASKTLTITKAFEDAIATGKGPEYKLYMKLQRDIPGLKVIRKTHKTPTKYTTKSGDVFTHNQFKNLKYKNMEAFINALPNSEKYLEAYNFLRNGGGAVQASRYAAVRRWFSAQFPYYLNDPLFYLHHEVEIISILPFLAQTVKAENQN